MGNGLIQLTVMDDLNTSYNNCGRWSFPEAYSKKYHPFSWLVSGHDITYMVLTSFLYFGMAVGIDWVLSFPALRARLLPDKDVPEPVYPVGGAMYMRPLVSPTCPVGSPGAPACRHPKETRWRCAGCWLATATRAACGPGAGSPQPGMAPRPRVPACA